jgi:hypothetical protein
MPPGLAPASPRTPRYRLAKEVCTKLDWHDPLGRLREMACRKHLLALERQGRIVLPPGGRRRRTVWNRRWRGFVRPSAASSPIWARSLCNPSPPACCDIWGLLVQQFSFWHWEGFCPVLPCLADDTDDVQGHLGESQMQHHWRDR